LAYRLRAFRFAKLPGRLYVYQFSGMLPCHPEERYAENDFDYRACLGGLVR